MDGGAWWAAVHGVTLSDFTFTFHFYALEKEMATHSSVLAWRIPGTGEPGGLMSMGSHRVGHDWSDLAAAAFYRTQTFIAEGVPGMGTIIYRTLSWKIARKIWKQHYAQLGDTRIFDICLCKIKEHCKCKLLLCNAMCKALDFSWRHLSLGMHSLLTCIPLNTNTIKNFLSKSVG